MNITDEELKSLKFYQGTICDEITNGYYAVKHAYVTLNALMFDGIENEIARIKEGKKLKPQIIIDIDETLNVYSNLFSLMNKNISSNVAYNVFRAEREQAMNIIKNELKTISFFSTSKNSISQPEFQKKNGLALMDIYIPPNIPVIDFEQFLGVENIFYDQREVLLPPFLRLDLIESELNGDEKIIGISIINHQ